jgi:hypothetical protein
LSFFEQFEREELRVKSKMSAQMLMSRIEARIKKLGACGISISGSFVRTSRKCGNPSCRCATGGEKHPCCLLTSKVGGKTKTVYVPVDMEEEVERWVRERKKIKGLLKEIDEMGERIIRQHVGTRRAVDKNLKLRSQSRGT